VTEMILTSIFHCTSAVIVASDDRVVVVRGHDSMHVVEPHRLSPQNDYAPIADVTFSHIHQ